MAPHREGGQNTLINEGARFHIDADCMGAVAVFPERPMVFHI